MSASEKRMARGVGIMILAAVSEYVDLEKLGSSKIKELEIKVGEVALKAVIL